MPTAPPVAPARAARALLALAFLGAAIAAQAPTPRGSAAAGPAGFAGAEGPVLWLRADAGVERGLSSLVTSWQDQAEGALVLAQDRGRAWPYWDRYAVNGRPALSFDGNDFLAAPSGMPLGSSTVVALVVPHGFDGPSAILGGGEHAASHAFGFTADGRLRAARSDVELAAAVPVTPGTAVVASCVHAAASGATELRLDGATVAAGVLPPMGDAAVQVGACGSSSWYRGLVLELAVFDRALGPHELALVEAEMLARAFAAPFPAVELTARPRDGALAPRDAQDGAELELAGVVKSPGWTAALVEVTRDGAPFLALSQPLAYAGGEAPFVLAPRIDAGLFDHDLSLRLVGPAGELEVERVENVACGDVFLVEGQSNAVAPDWHDEHLANQSQSEWIRSFGTPEWYKGLTYQGTIVAKTPHLDRHWGVADGETTHEFASVGGWQLRMGEILVGQLGVPVAFLNGAVEGTMVVEHQRNDGQPDHPSTIYGRLLQRAQDAGVAEHARALFWYQGDSDGEHAEAWKSGFEALLADWPKDYPALERVFLFQIREGCAMSNTKVREAQRQMPKQHAWTAVMSTTGAPGHDGCHYHYAGYLELGNRIARVALRDLYGFTFSSQIDPPDVGSARWRDATHTRVLIETSDPGQVLLAQPGVEDDFVLEDGVEVLAVAASGATLELLLAAPSSAEWVSYEGHSFDGPWVLNAKGVGMLTFFEVPIEAPR